MNLNQLAKQITLREGLKKQVNIAQVKEILRVIVDMEIECLLGEDTNKLALQSINVTGLCGREIEEALRKIIDRSKKKPKKAKRK